ncbi:hypothetical protein M758_9G177700 [Ceratodon purpureus]|nr:hypothetical protein M758_9G177700 [Ceratodon purpureus]
MGQAGAAVDRAWVRAAGFPRLCLNGSSRRLGALPGSVSLPARVPGFIPSHLGLLFLLWCRGFDWRREVD